MLSFYNDTNLKNKYVGRVQAHLAADEIRQGLGWNGMYGCCIGCLSHAYPAHETLAHNLGIDEALFHLADAIHEELPIHLAKTWPERFVSVIPVGIELCHIRWQFLHWLLTEPSINFGIEHKYVRSAVREVSDLCSFAVLGEMPIKARWSDAAAVSAAASAVAWSEESVASKKLAWPEARSLTAAARSAAAAALAAESASRPASAARSVEAAAQSTASAARSSWERMSEMLLQMLSGHASVRSSPIMR